MPGKAITLPLLVMAFFVTAGCEDRGAKLSEANKQGFCLRYAAGLVGIAFEHGTVTKHREELNESYLAIMRRVKVDESTSDAWWKGYYDGDVQLRAKLPSWASGTAAATEADLDAAFRDFQYLCKEQLADVG